MPANAMVVFAFQLAGLVHQPPIKMELRILQRSMDMRWVGGWVMGTYQLATRPPSGTDISLLRPTP